MSKEGDLLVHPEDREYYTRRMVIVKGLRVIRNAGIAAIVGSSAHLFYKEAKVEEEVARTHPLPSENDYALAAKTLEGQARFGDQSQKRVDWAQTQLAQQEAHDKELKRGRENLKMSWWKIGKYPFVGGGGAAVGGALAELIVTGKTEKELYRRDLIRFNASRKSETDTK
jgi:hypothetical protein